MRSIETGKIAKNLHRVKQQIKQAAQECQRQPDAIRLIAVSKTKPVSAILEAYQAGQRLFGENYVQEAVAKIEALSDHTDMEWHYIGRIQSNKTRLIAKYFDWVHTLSQIKHARRLSQQREGQPLKICIQLNISGEASKSGIAPDELDDFAAEVQALPQLELKGLMTMPPATADAQEQKRIFEQLRQALSELQQKGYAVDQLSMGMSKDMEIAICAGSTMVRIGTAIFGARS